MPQPSEEPKPGFIRVKYILTYESDIDLSAYAGMSPDEAIAHELSNDTENILEIIMNTDEDDGSLIVARDVQYVTE